MDLPFLTADLPGTGGVLRASDDDFFVDEIPAYAPAGTGDHVFARIEKRGVSTPQAVERIARALGVNQRDIGVAGMKDRHAVTRQWISLPPPTTPEAVQALALEDLSILEVARHGHKLRTGHVRANRFRLRVRQCVPDAAARARAILEKLGAAPGAPNWYGEQRFGRDGDNAARGRAIVLRTEKPPRDRRLARLLVSAFQSELFNAWLRARIDDGLYARVLAGDILHVRRRAVRAGEGLHDAWRGGGMFSCEDPATDEPRLLAGELCVTGPMFGARMRRPPPGSPAAAREDAILDVAADAIDEGTRRDASIEVADWTVEPLDAGSIEVFFTLPGGAYATTVMREVQKSS